MSSPVPTPVAAALGLVPTVVDGVKSLPGKAVQLPVLAISSALTALETVRREYGDLAGRGERVVARLRGADPDGQEAWAPELTGITESRPVEIAEDLVDDTVAKISALLDKAAEPAKKAVGTKAGTQDSGTDTPEPAASGPVETAATPEVVATVEATVEAVDAPEVTAHDDLPLPDYDHMTLGSLRGRLRSLTVEQLVQVRDYEKAHAHRLPVVTLLDNRIAKLATDPGATPSSGGGEVVTPPAEPAKAITEPAAPRTTAARTKVRTT
ncbi:MAG: hypothetical protein ACXVGH_06785 [Mycobacteriales bacterium]